VCAAQDREEKHSVQGPEGRIERGVTQPYSQPLRTQGAQRTQ